MNDIKYFHGQNEPADFLNLIFPGNKKIYISGAIEGMPDKNMDAFLTVANYITSINSAPINPHVLGLQITKKNPSWEDYMKNDIRSLVDCDAVVVMDGWETSKGVAVEVFLAQQMKIPVFHFPSLEIFSYHFNLQKEKINY